MLSLFVLFGFPTIAADARKFLEGLDEILHDFECFLPVLDDLLRMLANSWILLTKSSAIFNISCGHLPILADSCADPLRIPTDS